MSISKGITRAGLAGVAVILLMANADVPSPSVWRDGFQSSPATYEPPTDDFVRFAAAQSKFSPESIRAGWSPQPVSGTIRYRVMIDGAGSQIRIRLSNEEGKVAVRLEAASVGFADTGFSARAGTLQALTFGGAANIAIPAGAPVVSDPVRIIVRPGTELVISAALASPMANESRGGAGFALAPGNQALRPVLDQPRQMTGRPLVSGISVLSTPARRVIVAFGDSITDGSRSTTSVLHGWPEELARRLAARKGRSAYSVINAGISGNRILAPGWGAAALARLDRDALRIDGISHLILLEGINDIGMAGKSAFADNPAISADDLIAGYRQIIARSHARGVKVYVGTLTPNGGSATHSSPAKDAIREAVNRWIRSSGEADAVIDFEAITRAPGAPTGFDPKLDSGDHLHPNNDGQKAMGDGIDLHLFP